ncbi:MAG: hypothetical protein R6U95_07000 [Bacteroidales bacterium]
MIQYFSHSQIDTAKWDACIDKSYNAEVYAYSWFLNSVSPGWNAVVMDDYEVVMPIPEKKMYGVSYVVQPPYCQKLGIFSPEPLPVQIRKKFTRFLKRYVSVRFFSNIPLRTWNKHIEEPNFELDISQSCDDIYSQFNKNTCRNIKKAYSVIHEVVSVSVDDVIQFYNYNVPHSLPQSYWRVLEHLLRVFYSKNILQCLAVYSGNSIIAVAVFIISKHKAYYFLAASNAEGKEKRAMFAIIDSFIRSYSQSISVLDFEGSNVSGVANFYKGFGAKLVPYYKFEYHKIPFLGKFIT